MGTDQKARDFAERMALGNHRPLLDSMHIGLFDKRCDRDNGLLAMTTLRDEPVLVLRLAPDDVQTDRLDPVVVCWAEVAEGEHDNVFLRMSALKPIILDRPIYWQAFRVLSWRRPLPRIKRSDLRRVV